MKWSEVKKRIEELGVKDEDEIWYIDITFDGVIEATKDRSIGWQIWN